MPQKKQDGSSSESDEDFVVAKPPATAAARIMKKSVAACKVIEYIQYFLGIVILMSSISIP